MMNPQSSKEHRKRRNPFVHLAPFAKRNAAFFAGRDREIDQVTRMVLSRPLVLIIGESGVGKTSLVEAGVVPRVERQGYRIVRFSFHDDPLGSLHTSLRKFARLSRRSEKLGDTIRRCFKKCSGLHGLLIIGDRFEQIITVHKSADANAQFARELSSVFENDMALSFLFCVREDYLPEIYSMSASLPHLYDRQNTFRLLRLEPDAAREALRVASQQAVVSLSHALVDRIVQDLSDEGDGAIYPPFLQMVGFQLYAACQVTRRQSTEHQRITSSLYTRLGGVQGIVQNYFDGFLDVFMPDETPTVARILSTMVSDYYTRKTIDKDELQRGLPDCENLDRLLAKLVQHRIVRRTPTGFELIHDLLAPRVVELIAHQGPKLRVFLCHASEDKAVVRELHSRLASAGVDPWLDEHKLLPGQEWPFEIPEAVRQSDVVIVCLSRKSICKEGYVQREIRIALDAAEEKPEGTIFIVPLRLDECQLPARLRRWQCVNYSDALGYQKLIQALRIRADQLERWMR